MLTKQARLWYNETLYWENGANAGGARRGALPKMLKERREY